MSDPWSINTWVPPVDPAWTNQAMYGTGGNPFLPTAFQSTNPFLPDEGYTTNPFLPSADPRTSANPFQTNLNPAVGDPGYNGQPLQQPPWYEDAPGSTVGTTTGADPRDLSTGVGRPQGSPSTRPGVSWDAINQWDTAVNQASQALGVPASHIKAVILMESNGDPGAVQNNPNVSGGATGGLMQVSSFWYTDESLRPYLGNMYGKLDPSNPEHQILIGAAVLRLGYDRANAAHPDWTEQQKWDAAHSWFFNPSGTGDSVNGRSNEAYVNEINTTVAEIEAGTPYADPSGRTTTPAPQPEQRQAGAPVGPGEQRALGSDSTYADPMTGPGDDLSQHEPPGLRGGSTAVPQGTSTNSEIVNIALSWVGNVQYPVTNTGNPGKGQPIDAYGGVDCSGFTYWLDQNYGDGSLTQGSGHQFVQLRDQGKITTDLSKLEPGAIVFFATGFSDNGTGTGASHVGIYLGDTNGDGEPEVVSAFSPEKDVIVTTFSGMGGAFLGGANEW